jgi:hypothetical protein
MGTVVTVVVVFLILVLVGQAAGYYRRRFSVADSTVSEGGDVAVSAAVGVGSGIAVLLLLLVLYLGLTQWDWLGRPGAGVPHVVVTAAPISSPANPGGPMVPSPSTKTSP